MERIKQEFNTTTWVMIPVAIALNIAIGSLVQFLKIPLYLDSIGTVLVAVLAGPFAGALTGLLSNLIWALFPGQSWLAWFAPVAAVIGLMAGFWARSGWFQRSWKAIVAGLVTGLVAAVLSAPLSIACCGGVTGTGQDFLVAAFSQMGANIQVAALGQGAVADPIDKTVSFLVVLLIVRDLPRRFMARFPQAAFLKESDTGREAAA
jgi:energy-coupling factor transport system substrate-specific component